MNAYLQVLYGNDLYTFKSQEKVSNVLKPIHECRFWYVLVIAKRVTWSGSHDIYDDHPRIYIQYMYGHNRGCCNTLNVEHRGLNFFGVFIFVWRWVHNNGRLLQLFLLNLLWHKRLVVWASTNQLSDYSIERTIFGLIYSYLPWIVRIERECGEMSLNISISSINFSLIWLLADCRYRFVACCGLYSNFGVDGVDGIKFATKVRGNVYETIRCIASQSSMTNTCKR